LQESEKSRSSHLLNPMLPDSFFTQGPVFSRAA
jgi:hypothetical protein